MLKIIAVAAIHAHALKQTCTETSQTLFVAAVLQDAAQMQSVMGSRKPNCIIVDEVDGTAGLHCSAFCQLHWSSCSSLRNWAWHSALHTLFSVVMLSQGWIACRGQRLEECRPGAAQAGVWVGCVVRTLAAKSPGCITLCVYVIATKWLRAATT